MRNRRTRSRLQPGETGDANRLWTAKSVGRAPLSQGYPLVTRHLTITDNNGNTVGSFDGPSGVAYFGNLGVGNITSDNVVTFGQNTVQRFIDYGNGSDITGDGLSPGVALADNFNRTGAWASLMSDNTHTWEQLSGTGANWTMQSGSAQVVLAASDSGFVSAQAGGLFEEVYVELQADKVPTTNVTSFDLMFRARNNGAWATNFNAYLIRFQMNITAVPPTISSFSGVDGTFTAMSATVNASDGAIFAINTKWSVRAQVYYNYGTQATTIRAKCWKTSTAEPAAWLITNTDSTTELTQRAGRVGFRAVSGAIGNPNITMKASGWVYHLLDPDLLAADDTTTGAADTTYYYTPAATSAPYATLARALRDVQNYNQAQCFLMYHRGDDVPFETSTHIDGYVGSGLLVITGANPVITGSLSFNGNGSQILVSGLTYSDPGGGDVIAGNFSATMLMAASRYIELKMLRIHSNLKSTSCVMAAQGSNARVERCQLDSGSTYDVLASHASFIQVVGNTGGVPAVNGYYASGSVILQSGTSPNLATSGANETGKMFAAATTDAPATPTAGNAPPPSSSATKIWYSNAGSTYGMSYGTWAGGSVVQGVYGGSQNHKGMWKWPAGVQSTLTGKTIDQAYIYITRLSYGGASQAQGIYLFSANTATLVASPGVTSGPTLIGSLAWGQSKWFKVPAGIATDLKTAVGGVTRLLGIFQGDGSPYVICSVNAKLKVTYH